MIEFTIDGVTIEAEAGSNVLSVALENGFEIPHLCYHDEVSPYGACRLCLVEVERGGRRTITASCTYTVQGPLNDPRRSTARGRDRDAHRQGPRPLLEGAVSGVGSEKLHGPVPSPTPYNSSRHIV